MRAVLRISAGLLVVALALLASVASLPVPRPPPPEWSYDTAFPLDVGVGYGEYDFHEEGDPVPLERGFQGGQHVNASLRAPDLEPQDASFVGWLWDPVNETVLADPVDFETSLEDGAFYSLPEGAVYALGATLFVDDPSIVGREAEIRVQLTLADGRVGRAWYRGTVDWLPVDYRDNRYEDAGVPDDDGGAEGPSDP